MNALSDPAHLSPAQLQRILAGLVLGLFLAALDQTVVAVVLPAIASDLHGDQALGWVVSAYLLAMTVATPILGKLSDLFGRRRLLEASIGTFMLASLFCGIAQDMPQLILARVLQGIGAGGLLSITQALIGDLIPPAERGRYQAWFSGMFALASLIGPPLGGLLGEQLSWHWVFWINLPLGLITLLLSRRNLSGLRERRREACIDYLGAVLLIVTLTPLLLLVTWLGAERDWTAANALCLVLALVCGMGFAAQQRRHVEPLIPPALFAIAPVRSGWLLLLFANFQAVGLAVLVPLHAGDGVGAAGSAAQLVALAIGAPLGAYLAGNLSARLRRYKPMIVTGNLLLPLALVGLALFWSGGATTLGLLTLCGVAIGLQFPSALVAVQSATPIEHLGAATGVCGLARGLGGALGVALLASLLSGMLPEGASLIGAEHVSRLQGVEGGALHQAFRQLLLLDAGFALVPLVIALRLDDRPLRGRD